MKKITVSILTTLLMLSMVFSSSVFAANEEVSAWDSFLGLFSAKTTSTDVGVEYRGHIQNVGNYPLDGSWIQGPTRLGTVGQSLRLEGFWIQLTNKPADVNIKYQVHVQNVGWMDPVQNGAFAGTEGKSQQIEAIKISLVDNSGNPATGYSVEYRGHVQNIGDTAWYKDGAQLGTDGQFLRLEALEVKIVKEGSDLTAYNEAVAAANALTEADYTADSWAALQTALEDNVVTADNTQEEVDAATAAINDAIDGLEEVLKVTSVSVINGPAALEGAVVDRNIAIQVTFNKEIDSTTVNGSNFTLYKGTVITAANVPTLSADKKTVTVRTLANSPLAAATAYKLTVGTNVATTDGEKLPEAKTTNFTTNSLNAVRLTTAGSGGSATNVSTDIAQNAVLTSGAISKVALTFIDGVNAGTVTPSTVKLTNVSTGVVYTDQAGVTVTSAAGVVTIDLSGATNASYTTIPVDQEIKVDVTNGVLDYSANPVAPFTRTFYTGAVFAVSSTTIADGSALASNPNVNPSLSAYTNAAGTVYPGFRILTTFTRDINAATLTDDTMYLRNVLTGAQVTGTVTFNASNKIATFVPDAALAELTNYEFIVSKGGTVTDTNGIALAEQAAVAFSTMDVTAPTITSTTPAAGSATFAFDGDIVINFSEKMDSATTTLSNGTGTVANPFATFTIALKDETNSTSTALADIDLATNYTPSWNTAKTVLTLKHKTGGANLTANTTYSILVKGYDSTAGAAFVKDNAGIALTENNTFTFATGAGDTTKPTVTTIKSGSYSTGTTLTAGQTNVDETKDIQIVFSEKLDNTTLIQKADNIVLEKQNTTTGVWSAVGGAWVTGNATVTYDAVNNVSYVLIDAASIPADSKLRIRIVPESTTHKVVDMNGNLIAAGYSFEFTTKGTLGLTATGTITTSTVTAEAAAGATALTTALNAGTNVVAVEMANGHFFFDTPASGAGGTTTLSTGLPVVVSNGATIVDMTTSKGSFSQMQTGYNISDPLAIVISGTATDLPDLDTINNTTVTLTQGGTVVATTVDSTIIGTNAYVTINPTESLAANTQYTVSVLGVKDALGNEITTAQTRTFVSGAATVAQLNIDSVVPADVATGVAVDEPIVINFNEVPTTRPTTLAAGASGAAAQTISLTDGTNFVAGAIAWSNGNKTATITPTAFLKANQIYELQIGGAFVSSASGATTLNARGIKVTYNFTTEEPASVDAAITSAVYYDADGSSTVTVGDLIIVQFNTAIDPASLNADPKVDFALNAGGVLDNGANDSAISLSADGLTATITLGTGPIVIPNAMKINPISGAVTTLNGVNVSTTQVTITK